jgi:hypothetical protein
MTSSKDYGKAGDESVLVPSALRVYRHFKMNMEDALLRPCSMEEPAYQPGVAATDDGVFTAECLKYGTQLWPRVHENRGAPEVGCSCGFYAHYEPDDDFYPFHRWHVRRQSQPAWGYNGYGGGGLLDAGPWRVGASMAMVKAVCEVQGKVVMGSRGVRAAKLKVVAVAPDWSKWEDVSRTPFPESACFDDSSMSMAEYSAARQEWLERCRTPSREARQAVTAAMRQLAENYQAKAYDDVEGMLADHPKPDLSALGVKPAVETVDTWTEYLKVLNGKVVADPFRRWLPSPTQAAKVSGLKGGTIHLSFHHLSFYDEAPKAGATEMERLTTAYERALAAKKNKPAAPGSGIDRRRGRLR